MLVREGKAAAFFWLDGRLAWEPTNFLGMTYERRFMMSTVENSCHFFALGKVVIAIIRSSTFLASHCWRNNSLLSTPDASKKEGLIKGQWWLIITWIYLPPINLHLHSFATVTGWGPTPDIHIIYIYRCSFGGLKNKNWLSISRLKLLWPWCGVRKNPLHLEFRSLVSWVCIPCFRMDEWMIVNYESVHNLLRTWSSRFTF